MAPYLTMVLTMVLLLWIVTAVHEAGHALAVRVKGGAVESFRVGWGPGVGRTTRSGLRVSLGLIPLGGQIRYRGVAPGTGTAVVAVAGPLANLLLAVILLPGPGAVAQWLWLVPGSVVEILSTGQAPAMVEGVRAVTGALVVGSPRLLMLALGSLSAIWAALNLVPIPPIRRRGGSDGWNLLASLVGAAVAGVGTGVGTGVDAGLDAGLAAEAEGDEHHRGHHSDHHSDHSKGAS